MNSVTGFRDLQFGGNYYFYSGDHKEFEKETPNWLYGRNLCREYCMDAVNINTQKENEFIKNFMKKKEIRAIWTRQDFFLILHKSDLFLLCYASHNDLSDFSSDHMTSVRHF